MESLVLPWASTSKEKQAIEAVALKMVGRRLKIVEYIELAYVRENDRFITDTVDAVSLGIDFELDNGTRMAASWLLGGYREDQPYVLGDTSGLSLGPGTVRDRLGPLERHSRDVSASSNWAIRTDSRISDAKCIFMEEEFHDSPVQSVWSVRLDFESAPSVVIALGGPDSDDLASELHYEPKSVVAIFDEMVARGFRIDEQSAWGA